MTSKLEVFLLLFVFVLGFFSSSLSENEKLRQTVTNIFLQNQFNSTDSELILKSARENYFYLKGVERGNNINAKVNFAKNYANFLLKLFREIQIKNFDIYGLFLRENSFLKGYSDNQTTGDFNITELKTAIEDIQTAAQQLLVSHFNSSRERYEASEVFAINETSFDVFLKEKIRAEFSEIGYFFLEVFATLIGLSWGIISSVMHYTQSNLEGVSKII